MASVFKKDKRDKKASWYIDYFDENGGRQRVKGCPDRTATDQIARKLESDVELRRRGVIDSRDEAYRAHETRSVADHLKEFHACLLAKGNTAKHADLTVTRASRVVKSAGIERLIDLNPSRVQELLASLGREGLSLATLNHHRAAVRGFSRWLWRNGRLRDDPLVGVTGYNAKEDRRHDRRTIGVDELRRLVLTAYNGPPYRRMSGRARALCYRLAVATGLRFAEIQSVTPESLDFEASPSTVTVAAGYTKNGNPATLPLPDDVAADLRSWVADLSQGEPVFALPSRGADMLKVDLNAANIPYRDVAGLVFDFHSLRCQTATLADQAGCSPRVVQTLMRHSTLELTGRYTRPRAVDIERASSQLPPLGCDSSPEMMVATGTDPTAAASATGDASELHKPLELHAFTSCSQRNHNPRVGGSNPSAATCDRTRHVPPHLAVVRQRHIVRIRRSVQRSRGDLAKTRRTLPRLVPRARQ